MSEPKKKEKPRHRRVSPETRSRFAEIGYLLLAFACEVLFTGVALSAIAELLLPRMNLHVPQLWTWLLAAFIWEAYGWVKGLYQRRLLSYAKEEHQHHSPAPVNPMEGFVPVQVVMAPSPITIPKEPVPDAPPKGE